MIYLDYSATTPPDLEVLKSFSHASRDFFANANSLHTLGVRSRDLIRKATNQIADLLNVKPEEIIYTSGASESNNMVLKGLLASTGENRKHIITTPLEHASISAVVDDLKTKGCEISYVPLKEDGVVDLEALSSMIREDTILVSIASVSSELGILQPVQEIAKIVKKHPACYFHSDMTQSMGKVDIPLTDIDFVSFSAHKFYGIKGIGCLIKKSGVPMHPLIQGGDSTTPYRSGTPATASIVAMSRALRLALENGQNRRKKVKELNEYLDKEMRKIDDVVINSTTASIPHIYNFSVLSVQPETLLHAFDAHEIYLSTKSACSSKKPESLAVLALYHDNLRASSSLRISISHLTTKEELDTFLSVLKEEIQKLKMR